MATLLQNVFPDLDFRNFYVTKVGKALLVAQRFLSKSCLKTTHNFYGQHNFSNEYKEILDSE